LAGKSLVRKTDYIGTAGDLLLFDNGKKKLSLIKGQHWELFLNNDKANFRLDIWPMGVNRVRNMATR
jgi:hypothetical protein